MGVGYLDNDGTLHFYEVDMSAEEVGPNMTPEEMAENVQKNLRTIQGLKKKHGDKIEISFKYLTNTGKWKKREGQLVAIDAEERIRLFNDGKERSADYELARIVGIKKK
jgi:hypothetical protein